MRWWVQRTRIVSTSLCTICTRVWSP